MRVTIASDSTGVVSVDDNGASLTVDNGGTFAVQDSEKVADNAAFTDGTTKVLPAGFIFDEVAGTALTENDAGAARMDSKRAQVGVIEDATTRGRRATVSAGGALLTDASATTQPVSGTVAATQSGTWTVQPGNTANTTAWKVDASSVAVPVTDNSGSLTVDNGGTFAVQDSQVVADNAGFTDGTTKVFIGGYIYDEVAGTALTENDAAAARINVNRAQVGIIEDGATRGRYATVSASNALKVDGSAVTQPVSYATTGSGNATGALRVELANNGTGTLSTLSTVTTVSTLTGGGVAHDSADSGNPVKVGGKAGTADVTAVTDGDRTDMRFDTLGHQVIRPYALHENLISGATGAITDTTSTSVLAAAGAGIRNYITSVLVTNSHATVGTLVTIKDNAGSTPYAGYAAAAGGGFSVSFPTPLRGAANTATHAVCGTTGSNVYVSASGYKSAV